MTNVLSLSAMTSAQLTYATSLVMFANNKKVSLKDIGQNGLLPDIGALMWSSAYSGGTIGNTLTTFHWDNRTVEYDSNSWTSTSSTGLFYISNDKFSYVQLGVCLSTTLGDPGEFHMTKNNSPYPGLPERHMDYKSNVTTFGPGVYNLMSAPIDVASGDFFTVKARHGALGWRWYANSGNCFWIRGIQR